MTRTVDLHLHGELTVRLVDASDADVDTVRRDAGLSVGAVAGDADITVTFVDKLDIGPLTLLGLEAGAAAEGYVTLPAGSRGGRCLLPLEQVGGRCSITCERAADGVPLLIDIVNLTAASRGLLPLHGAAFGLHDLGWVLTGWSKGGKTETLLAVAERGASIVGDEWVYLRDGRVLGTAHRMRLWQWQLEQAPAVQARLTAKQRRRLALADRLVRWHSSATPALRRSLPYKVLSQLMPVVHEQHGVYVAPQDVFASAALSLEASVDRLLLVESLETDGTSWERIDPTLVADRMAASLEYERADLRAAWTRYQFAVPTARNSWLEQVADRERELLRAAFAGVPAYRIVHPYPVDLRELAGAVDAIATEGT